VGATHHELVVHRDCDPDRGYHLFVSGFDKSARARFRRDPCAFLREVLINPETNRPFDLYSAQERYLREALTLQPDGTLPYSELIYSTPKKGGKTATTAMAMLYVIIVLAGPYGEGYCCANDYEQAQGRVFEAISRIIKASPLLKRSAKITGDKILFTSTGSTITAIASHYASAAGANPSFITFDELWAYSTTAAERMWDEMIPVPTRAVSARWTSTYAGYTGESKTLEALYNRGLGGHEIAPNLYRNGGLLMFWSHEPVAPWQTQRWLAQMREQHRTNAYLRQIENRWVTSESSFVEMEWWDSCVDVAVRPVVADRRMPVWIGLDASVKRDSTAIVCTTWDEAEKRVRLVWHRIFQPSSKDPLHFEATIEATLMELNEKFDVKEVRFDPFQLVAVSQRLRGHYLPMVEFVQSVPNLTESSTNLYELIKGRNLAVYPDDGIRLAVSRTVALETSRGWRIAKEKQSHKIDVVVALAMAALGATQQGQESEPAITRYYQDRVAQMAAEEARQSDAPPVPPAEQQRLEETEADIQADARELLDIYQGNVGRESLSPSFEPWPRKRGW
jgi:phage terminase large subunit-like protein